MTTVISNCICLFVSTSTEQGVRPMQMYGTGSSEVRAQNLDRYWCGMKVILGGQISHFSDITWDLADGFAPREFNFFDDQYSMAI